MKPIPSAFSEKGGFSAQFVSDGYSVDAKSEILPAVITATGVQVGEGTAWDLVVSFLKACAQRAANTGETVNVGSLMSFGLAIKGWYAYKDSKAAKDNVHVSATLLGDLRPTVAFSMSNALDGATLVLYTVMSEGCGLGHVRQGASFRINGKELRMLDGDTVTAALKTDGGETVEARCQVTESDDDHLDATLPDAFSDAAYVGREVRITVRGRCGDPAAGMQEKSITATLDASVTPPGPAVEPPRITGAHSEGESDGEVNCGGAPLYVEGDNLETVTQVELLDESGEVFHTVSATYADDLLTTEDIEDVSRVPQHGSIRVTTAGGSDTYDVAYGNH